METNLSIFTDMHVTAQKGRVQAWNRMVHLLKNKNPGITKTQINEALLKGEPEFRGDVDQRLLGIFNRFKSAEETLEDYIAEEFESHPTYPWTSRIKGCGKEAAAKVIGIIEGVTFSGAVFGDLKEIGVVKNLDEFKEKRVELEGKYPELFQRRSSIYAFDTPSRLRRFDGLAPVDGKAERVARGQKGLHYSPELRMMLWRLLTSLMRARGVWYGKYSENDEYYMRRFERDKIEVIPTPAGRFCGVCLEEKDVPKTTKNCPDCGAKLMAKDEPPGVIFRGHVVNMAKRRTIRLWSDCLWIVWREALKLPTRVPWVLEYGGHTTLINPWEMVDK